MEASVSKHCRKCWKGYRRSFRRRRSSSGRLRDKLGDLIFCLPLADGNHEEGLRPGMKFRDLKRVYMLVCSVLERLNNIKAWADASITDLNYDDAFNHSANRHGRRKKVDHGCRYQAGRL